MSKQAVIESGNAFRRGAWAEGAELIDPKVIDSGESPEAKDRLRYARAFGLYHAGNPQQALATLDAIDPARREARAVQKLIGVAAIAAGELERARVALGALVQAGDRESIPTYQGVLVRRGLEAVGARDWPTALDTLRAAQIQHIPDAPTKFAAWLGLLAACEGGDQTNVQSTYAMFPEWGHDPRPNLYAARTAIALLDMKTAIRHLELLGAHAEVWPLWWQLCRTLFTKGYNKEIVALFEHGRAGMPDVYAKATQTVAAIALYALRKNDDAQNQIEQLSVRFPDDKLVAHAASFLAYAAGNFGRCEAHLRRIEADTSEPVALLRWAVMFSRERYEPIRDALNPEAVRAWPEGTERDTASMMGALANTLLGSTSRAWALLRTSGDPSRPSASAALKYLGGYLALAEKQYGQAAALLGPAPLGAIAKLEHAREQADAGAHAPAIAELAQALGKGIDPIVIETRNIIRLAQAQVLVKSDHVGEAQQLLAQVRAEAPALADRVAGLEDYVAVRATLAQVRDADPAQVAEVLWRLYGTTPAQASPAQASARRRDLAYLTGVMRLRAFGTRPMRGGTAAILEALEASLDEDDKFAPAAAVLGVIANHRGDPRRALELLDLANQGGLSTPSIQAALAGAYVRDGRLIEAKRIFLDQFATERQAGAIESLREIFAQEAVPLLRTRDATPAIAMPKTAHEAPDLPASVDVFAGIDPKQRVFALIAHAEARGTPELVELARELKRMSIAGVGPAFVEVEQRAIALLGGA